MTSVPVIGGRLDGLPRLVHRRDDVVHRSTAGVVRRSYTGVVAVRPPPPPSLSGNGAALDEIFERSRDLSDLESDRRPFWNYLL